METKKTFHSAITGKFVSKDFAKENPDTTVEITTCNLELVVNVRGYGVGFLRI